MLQPKFANNSLLMSATPEQRVVIAFSMLDVEVLREDIEKLFSARLNWPWIIMQAMHHRTVSMQWGALKRLSLVRGASKSGMPKNWIAYCDQLSRASTKRNEKWLERLEDVFQALETAGIKAVCIKGGALIGDLYDSQTRMLGDIDTLAPKQDRKAVRDVLLQFGFKQGVIDPVTSKIEPLSREKRLFWSINAHLMPKFTLDLHDPDCPFLRLAVGFDFFDPGDPHSYPSEAVISRRIAKSPSSHVYVPDAADTIISLCVHIFRDATSATMGFAGDNWNLWKFCDFRSKLAQVDSAEITKVLRPRLEAAGLEKAFYYALYYTDKVYGDPRLEPWFDLCGRLDNFDYLCEIADGQRRVRYDRQFVDQLFDTERLEVPGLQPVWSKVMGDGEWW